MYDTDEYKLLQKIDNLKRDERLSSEQFIEAVCEILKEIVEAIPKHTDPGQE
jgi:hypothetical protein